jgi:ABC-2 type transport system ATP-binding protein
MQTSMRAAVTIRGLGKRYGKHTALEDFDLTVERGSVLALLGPNGAGKSTALRLVAGLLRPTAGTVQIGGIDVQQWKDRAQGLMGYLPGDFVAYKDMTSLSYLQFMASLRREAMPAEARVLAGMLGLDLSRPIGDLSKGNRQKVGLIQAMMHRPEVLLLDEPTTGLDPLMKAGFQSLIRDTVTDGRTVLLSTHDLSEASAAADNVAIIDRGRLLLTSPVEELLAKRTKHVELRFAGPRPSKEQLEVLPGIGDVVVDQNVARLTVRGSTAPLVRALATYDVIDVTVHEADLREVFLSFYRQEGFSSDPRNLHESHVGPAPEPVRMG